MKTYIVTGANRGIGLELVRQIASAGDKAIATCRAPGEAHALNEIATDSNGLVRVEPLDVTSALSVTRFKSAINGQSVDVLINNAGIMGGNPQSPLDMDFDTFSQVMAVNTMAPLRVTQAVLPNLERARGTVVVISSLMGSFSFNETGKIAYCTSKTAVNRLFRVLSFDLKPKGVSVAILSPGWVKTDMGGPGAHLDVEDSARGLLEQIAGWNMEKTGSFSNYAGDDLSW